MTSRIVPLVIVALFMGVWVVQEWDPVASVRIRQAQDDILVRLNVSVWDGEGKPVLDLDERDFTITQEEGRPLPAQRFLRPSAPLQLLLLLDTSGSMSTTMPRVKASMKTFISLIGQYREVAVVSFAASPRLETDFSGNIDRLRQVIDGLQFAMEQNEVTRLFDSLEPAIDHLKASGSKARTTIILYSDGHDNGSQRSSESVALRTATRSFVTVHTIQARGRDKSFLKKLAEVTGGLFMKADADLEKSLEDLARQLPSQYVLAIKPSPVGQGKKPVAIEVKVSRPGLKVVAPTSYAALPAE